MQLLTKDQLRLYIDTLRGRGYSSKEVVEKIQSLSTFYQWALKQNKLPQQDFNQLQKLIANETVRFHNHQRFSHRLSSAFSFLHKKTFTQESPTPPEKPEFIEKKHVLHHISNQLDLRHYIAITVILVFMGIIGASLYQRFFVKSSPSLAAYPSTFQRAGRTLSFQGRLTDSSSNPITSSTNVTYSFYTVSSAGSVISTDSPTRICTASPDQDGIFSTMIGGDATCNTELPDSLFSNNPTLYMQVTIGGQDLTPRQPIANVAYAINSETLQGFPPGTGVSNIAYIDANGTMAAAPGVTASAGSTSYILKSTSVVSGNISTAQTNLYSLYNVPTLNMSVGSSGITNVFGEYVGLAVSLGNTVTNYYGAYVSAPTGSGTVTNKYAFVSENGAGNVGIGTTAPNATLQVVGNIVASTGIGITGTSTFTNGLSTGGSVVVTSGGIGVTGLGNFTNGIKSGGSIVMTSGGLLINSGGIGVTGIGNFYNGISSGGSIVVTAGGIGVSGASFFTNGLSSAAGIGVTGLGVFTNGLTSGGSVVVTSGGIGVTGLGNFTNSISTGNSIVVNAGGIGVTGNSLIN